MFINALFLSKLLNLKTGKHSADSPEDSFSYLFSEIIKVKSAEQSTNFAVENIGGTLLDHKTIFISNSSPLENKSVLKIADSSQIIEGLYKLFSVESSDVIENDETTFTLNKITTDKLQFVTGVVSLIQNILTRTINHNGNAEIRYVSQNMIETKKVNLSNLNQFSNFLSGIIDNNPTFSFVISANSKQILFDVENLIIPEDENRSVKTVAVPDTNSDADKVIPNLSTSQASESFSPEDKTFPARNSEANDNKSTLENNSEINSEKKNPVLKSVVEKDSMKLNPKQGNTPEIKNKFTGILNNAESDSLSEIITSVKIENPVDSGHSIQMIEDKNKIDLVPLPSKNYGQQPKVYVESGLKTQDTFRQKNIEYIKPQAEDVGEVKIIIKEKVQNSFQKNPDPDLLLNLPEEHSDREFQQPDVTSHSRKDEAGYKLNGTNQSVKADNTEKNLTEVVSIKNDEPKLSRAGLPLIPDYQDWDLVFENDETVNEGRIEKSKLKLTQTEDNETLVLSFKPKNSLPETDEKFKSLKKFSSEKVTEKDNGTSENKLVAAAKKDEISEEPVKSNNQQILKGDEKVLHLKFSGERRIITVSEPVKENSRIVVEQKTKQEFRTIEVVADQPVADELSIRKNTDKITAEQKVRSEDFFRDQLKEDDPSDNSDHRNYQKNEFEGNVQKSERAELSNKEEVKNNFKSEFQNVTKQDIQHEFKTQLLNNKTIIEHFIKNPSESRVLEKFIQILDKQEVIQKSEIVNYSKQNHSVEIKLAPEELGKIKILLDTNDNNVSAKIEVGNEQTKSIVVNNLPQLKETLSQQGVNLNYINVTVSSEEQKNSGHTKNKDRKKSQESHSKVEIAEEKRTIRNLGYNTYEFLA